MRGPTALILLGVFVCAPAVAAKPQIQWDQEYDFSKVKTFMWKDTAGESLAQSQPFLHSHIINAIEYQLSNVGWREVDSGADVMVTYYGSTETNYRLQSDSFGYSFGGYGRGGWGYYGYGMAGPVTTTTRVIDYERGTLVVDIVDAASDQLVWRGTVSDISVSDNLDKMKKYIDKAIAQMAKQAQKLRAKAEKRG